MAKSFLNSSEDGIINDILSLNRNRITELLSLTESPIEKVFLLLTLKYLEDQLVNNDFMGNMWINGFGYITNPDPLRKSTWEELIGIKITHASCGSKIALPKFRRADGSITTASIDKKDYSLREPHTLKDDRGNFSLIQQLNLIPQCEVEIDNQTFRLDFAFLLYEIIEHEFQLVKKIGIECDGYEYHSSKEQFMKDRVRLRILVSDGWTIIPYSGSKINSFLNNPDSFSKEMGKIFSQLRFTPQGADGILRQRLE